MLRIHNSHELRTRLERKSSGKFPTVSRNGTSSPFETFYPKRYTISNNVWPTDGSSHYALYDTLTSVQETENRRGRYSDTRIHGAQETVLYPCTARQRSEADRVTRECSGRVSKHGYQGGKKKKRKEKKRKIGKKIDGGASEIIEWSTLRWSSRFSRCWQQWRAKQRGADKKVIDTDTNLKISWILIS